MKSKTNFKKVILDLQFGRILPIDGLSYIKENIYTSGLESYITRLFENPNRITKFIQKGLVPRNESELFTGDLLYYSKDINKDLAWKAVLIKNYTNEINEFIKLKEQFEIRLINGEYEQASKLLNTIKQNVGHSMWTLENSFLVEEYAKGLESNKEYLSKINKNEENVALLWFADIYSYKAEKTITDIQYQNRMDKLFDKGIHTTFKPYLAMKVFNLQKFSIEDLYNIIYYEGKSSIVDQYLSFIRIAQILCSSEDTDITILNNLRKCINILGLNIDDFSLTTLRIFLNMENLEIPSKIDFEMSEIGDIYTKGNYSEVIDRCSQVLETHSNHLEIYEYYIKALLYVGNQPDFKNDTIRNSILLNMYESYIKQGSTLEAYNSLLKYIRIFSNTGFGINLLNFFLNRFANEKKIELQRISELNSKHRNARFCLAFNLVESKLDFLDEFSEVYGEKTNINLFKYFYSNKTQNSLNDIAQNRLLWYDVQLDINSQDYDEALKKIFQLDTYYKKNESNIKFYMSEKIIVKKLNILMYKKEYESCTDLFISNYLENKYSVLRFDHINLYKLINNENIYTNISLAILTHICFKNYNLFGAYANFLEALHIKKPSELCGIKNHLFDLKKLTYFLKYICIPDIMDSSYNVFHSEEEVDDERTKICQYLRKIDIEDDKEYINEISRITEKYRLKTRIRILDESKISIDLNNIRKNKRELFIENYKRYVEIGNFVLNYDVIDINNKFYFIKYFDQDEKNIATEKRNQKYILFKELFYDYRDEFAFGHNGLDSSLSTRIRHGRLQNEIRNVFEQHRLIYSKYNSDDYVSSEDFDAEMLLSGVSINTLRKFNQIFCAFSKQIDDSIEEMNAKFIRIKTEELNPEGMINMIFDETQLLFFFKDSNQINNDEQLIDYFESLLMERTESSLRQIKNYLKEIWKDKFVNYINNLETQIIECLFDQKNSPEYSKINQNIASSRTAIQKQLNKVSEWFKLPQKQEYLDFNISQLIETCTAINSKLYPSFNEITIEIKNECFSIIKGYTFSYFIDILIILFTNAIIHSRFLNDLTKLQMELSIKEDDFYLHIEMKNNFSTDIDKKTIMATLGEIQKKIDECDSQKYHSFEGGSGYVKIVNIFRYNIYVQPYLYFGVDEDDFYFVKIVLEKPNIILRGTTIESIDY